jgi:hypothetical protein
MLVSQISIYSHLLSIDPVFTFIPFLYKKNKQRGSRKCTVKILPLCFLIWVFDYITKYLINAKLLILKN